LRLAGIALGRGVLSDVQPLDDELLEAELRKLAGDAAPAVRQAVARWSGPERLLDLALRGGPYGDGFGRRPAGLTLEKLHASSGGIDLGPLEPRVPELLRTPSGRIELAPAALMADLPRAAAALDEPPAPLVVIGRRDVRSNNSWMHNLPTLAKGPQRCTLQVHPADAARRGLADGSPAVLRGHAGHVPVRIELSDALMPGVVSLPHGWGHGLPGTRMAVAAERPGVNLNAVLDERRRDPLSGNAVLSGVPVELTAT
jgi:anaerobic selenocysteine-containing dehydrogenase